MYTMEWGLAAALHSTAADCNCAKVLLIGNVHFKFAKIRVKYLDPLDESFS